MKGRILLIALALITIGVGVTMLGALIFDETPSVFLLVLAVPLGFIADRMIRKRT